MAWTVDAVSQQPKIIYTYDGSGATSAGLKKLTYDPNAQNKWLAEFSFIANQGETVAEVEASLGVG